MSKDLKRRMNVAQLGMRMVQVEIAQATSLASGFDSKQIKQIIKNGAGDWTIILKRPFRKGNANKAKAFVMPLAAGVTYHLAASDHDRVNVVLSADVDFSIMIMGCDHRFNY